MTMLFSRVGDCYLNSLSNFRYYLKKISACLALLLIIIPISLSTSMAKAAEGKSAQKAAPPAMPPAPVEVAQPKQADIAEILKATGTIYAQQQIIISTEIAGRITKLNFKEGQFVQQGDLLIKLDDSMVQAILSKAKALLELSQAHYDRAKLLVDKGIGSKSDLEKDLAQMQSNQADVALAIAQLKKTEIRAPFSGYIGIQKIDEGEYVSAGQDIVGLQNIDTLKVQFRIPEMYMQTVAVGQEVELKFSAFKDKSFLGKVTAIDSQVDMDARSILIQAEFSNPNRALRPGLFAAVNLVLERHMKALLVPEQAVQFDGVNPILYFAIDNQAVPKSVKLGIHRDGWVEITQGLQGSDTIIIAGHIRLFPMASILITNSKNKK